MIKAVIFDMDGVLIDSEIVYLTYLYREMKKDYPFITIEDLRPIVGGSSAMTGKILYEAAGCPMEPEKFAIYIRNVFAGCQVWYPDIMRKEVPGLLKTLHDRGLKVGLASSTGPDGIDRVLTQCEIKESFDYIISGDMFKESKPNPEIYLFSAKKLEAESEECLVVEDSTYGITAGKRAGMTVAAMEDDRFGFDQSRADYKIHNLNQVLDILDELNG